MRSRGRNAEAALVFWGFQLRGSIRVLSAGSLCFAAILAAGTGQSLPGPRAAESAGAGTSEPWKPSQTVQPATLVKELAGPADSRPRVVCVGFHTLYEGAHIAGGVFEGPATKPERLAGLEKWAGPLPRTANLVIYCGCCPLAQCPNVRPAFNALREMGFTYVRLLLLPRDFAHDWVEKGYPVAKGK